MTGKERMKEELKKKIMEAGRDDAFAFTGVFLKNATEEEVERFIDNTLQHMSTEMFYGALRKYGLMPTYSYSGPITSPLMPDADQVVWEDRTAYEEGRMKAPTGSITIEHPDMKMMCRVTDDPLIPGFIITCRDNEGNDREFHIYLSTSSDLKGQGIRVCTSLKTNQELTDEDIIRKRYDVPFRCGRTCGNCSFNYKSELDTEPVCNNRDSHAYKHEVLDDERCEYYQ